MSIFHLAKIIYRFIFSFHIILLTILLYVQEGHSKLRDYETTRLKSTAGAGVGSLLLNEAAVLNPSSLAFFAASSLHFQVEKHQYTDGGDATNDNQNPYMQNKSFIATDTKRIAKGSFSYQDIYDDLNRRQRFSIGTGVPMGKDSAIGFSFRHTKDFDFSKSSAQEDVYNQILLGATHVANENLSFGLLIVDLMQKKKKDSRAFLGAQFMLSDIFALIGDVGAFYQNDLSETLVYRGAIQINFLSDFFVRAGFFEDKGQNEKGNGVGVSWVGPRFSMDLSLKTTKPITNDVPQGNTGSKLSETSMSVSLLF